MSIKYKIDDAKKNKNLINDEIKLSSVKTKGGNGGDGGRKPGNTNKITLAKLSNKVDTLANRVDALTNRVDTLTNRVDTLTKNVDTLTNSLDKLAKIVTDGFERQEKFNKQQLEFNKTIVNRLDRIVKVNNLKE